MKFEDDNMEDDLRILWELFHLLEIKTQFI